MSHEVMDMEHIDREQLVKALRECTAKLEAANKEMDQFSHSVSHDLRAPLRALEGFAQIIIEDYGKQLDEEGRRCLEIIGTSSRRASQLIEDLLTVSRLSRHELKPVHLNMHDLVEKIIADLKVNLRNRHVEFRLNPLPSAWADQELITEVWNHLLENALKFTRPRERAIIEIGASHEPDHTIYFVRDNGVGFEMKYVGRLFGIFQRLHADKDFPGRGIGLAIVQRLIHRHGGQVWAEGKLNEGAKFAFSLPDSETANLQNLLLSEEFLER